MSARKRAAGTAASPELDTPDPVKKRKKNEVRVLRERPLRCRSGACTYERNQSWAMQRCEEPCRSLRVHLKGKVQKLVSGWLQTTLTLYLEPGCLHTIDVP